MKGNKLFFGYFLLSAYTICCVQGIVVNGGNNGPGDGVQTANALVKPRRGVVILPQPGNQQNIVVKRTDETLNLTCIIEYYDADDANRSVSAEHSNNDQVYKLSWYLPITPQNSKQRINLIEEPNSLTLIVSNLKESDTGDYECMATSFTDPSFVLALPSKSIKIAVKPKRNSCGENFFACSTGECIQKRFLCDGRNDCKEATDESVTVCGIFNPCDGKLRCDDGRCISRQWCCERLVDPNCTTRITPGCCKQLLPIQFSLDVGQYTSQSQQFSDMGFLQTTIYTVIGCAMAFMFIITIMVIAICRVHLKRTSLPRYPPHWNQSTQNSQRQDSWGNLFLHSGGNVPYTSASSASGLLVTYNINNGVQFVQGRPANPPPYSEIARAPPREGPPPPYTSEENLTSASSSSPIDILENLSSSSTSQSHSVSAAQQSSQPQLRRTVYILQDDPEISANLEPLLSENNNGDINGNSTSEIQVEPNRHIRADLDATERESLFLSDCHLAI